MELELFTVVLKEDGIIDIEFNSELLEIVTEKELIEGISKDMEPMIPIANKIVNFIKTKI